MLYNAFQSARQRKSAPSRGVIYIPMEIFLLAVIDAAISSWRSEPAARLLLCRHAPLGRPDDSDVACVNSLTMDSDINLHSAPGLDRWLGERR